MLYLHSKLLMFQLFLTYVWPPPGSSLEKKKIIGVFYLYYFHMPRPYMQILLYSIIKSNKKSFKLQINQNFCNYLYNSALNFFTCCLGRMHWITKDFQALGISMKVLIPQHNQLTSIYNKSNLLYRIFSSLLHFIKDNTWIGNVRPETQKNKVFSML